MQSLSPEESMAGEAAAQVAAALQKKGEENVRLKAILDAFGKILIEQARWKALLPNPPIGELTLAAREKFEKGVPIADRTQIVRLGDLWQTAADKLIPSMLQGFSGIAAQLENLQNIILQDGSFPDSFIEAAYGSDIDRARELAARVDIDAELLLFVLQQLAKPAVEKRAEALFAQIRDLPWSRGYCPVCGSFPEVGFLMGKEGRRVLRCSFCASTWHFYRLSCPFCETENPDDREIFFVEGRPEERAEVCHKCKTYVTAIDLRNPPDACIQAILHLCLMHLDVIAQKKGFNPMKGIGWKAVSSEQ